MLPFENLGAAEDEYFADGVTDEVRGKLAALPGLQVIARSSSGEYKKTTKSPQEIGRELGVDYLLTGTVRWEKGGRRQSRVQVSPELIQVATAATTWQQPFDAALTDVFQVQADIAGRVAQALDVALGRRAEADAGGAADREPAGLRRVPQRRGSAQGLGGRRSARAPPGVGYYEQAVALDSTFVQAWVQLSRAHSSALQLRHAHTRRRGRRAATRRRGRSNWHRGDPRHQLAIGDYRQFVVADNQAALARLRGGAAKAPADADLLERRRRAEQSLGRWESSTERFAKAGAVDPRSALTARRQALDLLWLRALSRGRRPPRSRGSRSPRTPCCSTRARPWSGWRRANWRGRGT